jgi:two-component SAPR family response regulator
LERAVELYRGDLYENDEGSEWCDIERTALQREFIDALGTLARAYLTLGEGKRAMYALRRALAYDYSREDLHTELVRCLIRFRRHKEANEQICDCVRYLREELGVEPSAETQRLFHSLVK